MNKVSCVIPTMNRADDVVECVKSIWKSDYKKLEIIVVDDASNDDTVKRLKRLFGGKKNTKLITNELPVGAAKARNLGVGKATGEYLLFVDSDNVIDSKMISHLVSFFKCHDDCLKIGRAHV